MPAFNNVALSQIRAFERTVRLGGVHAAARHLGLTQPAVCPGTDVPEVKTRLDLLTKKAAAKGIHVMGPALPPTAGQAQKMAAAGFKAILLRNDLFCVRMICKQYIDDIAGPIRGD